MVDPEEVEEWLKKAKEDWQVAGILLASSEELTLPCMFHLQQMIEKLLKAVIIKRGKCIDRTHDLGRLVQIAELQHQEALLDLCDVLTLFAVNGRYPGDLPQVSISDAKMYYQSAIDIRKNLLQLLEGEKS